MTSAAIRTTGLTKDYGGGRGVFDLDLEVAAGEVFGYLGPNGAGKSTTIRMLLDLVRPTSGQAEVLGHNPRTAGPGLRARLSYIPGELALWKGWTAGTIITYLGQLHGGFEAERVDELAQRFQLDLDRVVADLSKGNKQKVGLVAAFAPRSELLILDEPTSGLDPLLQIEFQKVLREAVAQRTSVLLSSHVLSEVEHVADRVGIIRAGRLVDIVGVADLTAKASHTLEVTFAHDAPTVWPGASHTVLGLRGHDADLEQVFLRYYADPVVQTNAGPVVGQP
ncbi:MAG: ABC transporter ATP-binding protein [Euzebya sp.]